jgi:DNA repair protein RadC
VPTLDRPGALAAEAVTAPPSPAAPHLDAWRDGPADGRSPAGQGCPTCRRSAFRGGDATRPAMNGPEAAAELLVPALAHLDRERCVAALLDTKHRVIEQVVVSIGSVDHTFMAPREVYRDALLANASALVLAHNHPSGDPGPSRDDEQLTRRLVRAGELVGVDLLDHLVVGGERWVSLARRGVV